MQLPLIIRSLVARASGRSSVWPRVSDNFLRKNPRCAVCGQKATVAHHIVPVHIDKSKELDTDNLMPFCGTRCHLPWGHLFSWRAYNPHAVGDAAEMRWNVEHRPLSEKERVEGLMRMLQDED